MSTRAPPSNAPHPHDDVVAEAHDRRSRHRLDAALRPALIGGARLDDAPPASVDDSKRRIVGAARVDIGVERLDVGIGLELQLGGGEAGIDDRIGVARPRLGERVVAWRVDRIGGDVVDPRQVARLDRDDTSG